MPLVYHSKKRDSRKNHVFCAYKPNSVVGYPTDDHIPRMDVTNHLMRLSVEGTPDEFLHRESPRLRGLAHG